MSILTEELRHENYQIIQNLATAKRYGMRTLQGRNALFSQKDDLLMHLQKEDEQIHTVLKNAASTHPDVKQTLEMYKDIEKVSELTKIL